MDWYEPMVKDAPEQVLEVMKRFDPKHRRTHGQRNRELEAVVPTDEWIQRLLDMNVKIDSYDDYSLYLSSRWDIYRAKTAPEELADMKNWHGLADSVSLDKAIEADIRMTEKLHTQIKKAQAKPNRLMTIYVQPNTVYAGTGVPKELVYEIGKWKKGLVPKPKIPFYIDVIYLNENGQPIKH